MKKVDVITMLQFALTIGLMFSFSGCSESEQESPTGVWSLERRYVRGCSESVQESPIGCARRMVHRVLCCDCKGKGYFSTKCVYCNGVGSVVCEHCQGSGILCPRNGLGMSLPCGCTNGRELCWRCGGTGLSSEIIRCKRCDGHGSYLVGD